MDNLLKQVNLDFKFTAYQVLAFSKDDGMLEFVKDSFTIQDILQTNNNRIEDFLKKLATKKEGNQEIFDEEKFEEILDTYIRSCAGYCTVTYLMAVGDRHLENLMIDSFGRMFHIDFGFLFGKNPPAKQFGQAPIRICKEMIDAMGGNTHPHYENFKKKCVESFLYLRNYQSLILNLFHLMIHAGIKDLPFSEHEKLLSSMRDKFMPTKSNIEAEKEFLSIIKESVNAMFVKLYEKIHVWAQNFKK
jgi:phosphatidylinositol 3-kinase